MPMTMTWSQGPAASARVVAAPARAGPIPVTSAATDHSPTTPSWEKTASPVVALNPNDLMTAFSSGCMGASTAARLAEVVTPSIMPDR